MHCVIRVATWLLAVVDMGSSSATTSTFDANSRTVNQVNAFRASPAARPAAWSDELAEFANQWSSTLAVQRSTEQSGGPFGENVARIYNAPKLATDDDLVATALDAQAWRPECERFRKLVWNGTSMRDDAYVVMEFDPVGLRSQRVRVFDADNVLMLMFASSVSAVLMFTLLARLSETGSSTLSPNIKWNTF